MRGGNQGCPSSLAAPAAPAARATLVQHAAVVSDIAKRRGTLRLLGVPCRSGCPRPTFRVSPRHGRFASPSNQRIFALAITPRHPNKPEPRLLVSTTTDWRRRRKCWRSSERSARHSVCPRAASSQIAEDGAEAGLDVVLVGGEGVGDAAVLHDDEGDAVGQAPGLIRPGPVEIEGTLRQGAID